MAVHLTSIVIFWSEVLKFTIRGLIMEFEAPCYSSPAGGAVYLQCFVGEGEGSKPTTYCKRGSVQMFGTIDIYT